MSQNGQSLSVAAENAPPIPASPASEPVPRPSQGGLTNTTKHRRLSSTGRSRRRLSDARDAAARPLPTSLQTASASLAALSLSSPTVPQLPIFGGAQPIRVPRATSSTKDSSELEPSSDDHTSSSSHTVAKSGRRRGTIFTCESCSKVYRHPSCLIKHRWEHTPQWQEASKFVLSKHQQVQLLEAAAILSHLSPSSASLPEDRSLWPSFLSGGLVPLPTSAHNDSVGPIPTTTATSPPSGSSVHNSFPISSSVPVSSVLGSYRAGSTGPQLHDYALSVGGTGVTQVRPGMLGVSTTSMDGKSSPMPVPGQTRTTTEDDALNLLALSSGGSASVPSSSFSHAHSPVPVPAHVHSHSHSLSFSDVPSKEKERRWSNAYDYGSPGPGARFGYTSGSLGYGYASNVSGGWSLPRSSVRSKSGSSRSPSVSQSASESRSDDDEGLFGDALDLDEDGPGTRQMRVFGSRMRLWKVEDGDDDGGVSLREVAQGEAREGKGVSGSEETWDGMEMEMEMD